ncbi:uncharacterized protein DUF1992 [Scopulibacillus darangshiensis]|uniref:Uncharacterized protein DUF1992 n=1 Tax=Scopulibacillus darangshiensis TaxID=442528 RepID=A0A4R2P2M2_9BACL|nr:DnaJ family domain-containing protein [Scopulibacillus darangshiensis]TCP28882.1 uncharacterized protein DUF1992 [Scopulibacillus darangshiensis]
MGDRKYNDLIGEILEAAGEKDNYNGKGKGKPLPKSYMEKDLLQNFMEKAKDAGFLPPWLKLQKEISSLIHSAEDEENIKAINEKIKKYNTLCPPSLQKMPINFQELDKAKNTW